MKQVYFVRHGATDGSVNGVQQSSDTPLNERGINEAKIVGKRAAGLSFDTLFSSPARRAEETAEHIAASSGHSLQTEALFSERKRPSQFDGWDKTRPEYLAYLNEERGNLTDPDWKFADSESFTELIDRTKTALQLLQDTPGNSVVVSHEYIAKFFATYVLSAGSPSPALWAQIYASLRLSNTGITVFQYSTETNWQLLTWNDHAHFAE